MAINAESWIAAPPGSTALSSHSQNTLVSLPQDVLLQICFWLSVNDILSLRLVNKAICGVTKELSIWLSLLRRLTVALPPCQPMLLDSHSNNSMHTPEFFLTRALKLEQRWRNYNPLASHYRYNGHRRIVSMRFLPGGKHMVTVSQNPESGHESVVVWDMNFHGRRNHVAIAMLNSETPIEKLRAGYALAEGQISLFVAFTRPPTERKTVIIATYVPVEVLDSLSRYGPGSSAFLEYSQQISNPFKRILESQTRYPVGAMSLSDTHGHPILAVVYRPRTVAFFDLSSGVRTSLKLGAVSGYSQWRHSIWDVKILSSQRQVLVIRVLIGEVNTMDTLPLVFETYDIPVVGVDVNGPVPCQRRLILHHSVDGFFVSDGDASWDFRNHPDPNVSMLHRVAQCPPPPISIFVTTRSPRGFIHFLMLPDMAGDDSGTAGGAPRYIYNLPAGTHAQYEWDEDERAIIIPGAYRSVVWMRSTQRQPLGGIAVLRLAVYRTEGYLFSDSSDTGHISTLPPGTTGASKGIAGDENMDLDEELVNAADGETAAAENPRRRAMKYPVVPVEVARAMRNGTLCLQFDEWLGRLCVATTEDNWIRVLDWSI